MNRRHFVAASIALATAELGAATSCTPGPAPAHVAHHGGEDSGRIPGGIPYQDTDTLTVQGWVLDEFRSTSTTATTEEPTTTTTEPEPEPIVPTIVPTIVSPRRTTTTARRTTTTTTVYEPPSPQGRTVEPAGDVWWQLALCESGGANVDTGNGYSGYFQFADATWRSLGYAGRAVDHSYATQLAAAQRLQARSGWGQWPACSRQLGLA